MAKALDVAKLFIDIAQKQADNEQGDGMSNLRLQKLLYFAQGWHIARYGEPLFDAPMELWKRGPVVPSIYRHYQRFGRNPIHDAPPSENAFSDEERALIMDIIREYWDYSASALINMSHEPGTPWAKLYREDAQHIPLTNVELKEYFGSLPPIRTFDDVLAAAIKKIPVVSPIGYTESGAAVFAKTDLADWSAKA